MSIDTITTNTTTTTATSEVWIKATCMFCQQLLNIDVMMDMLQSRGDAILLLQDRRVGVGRVAQHDDDDNEDDTGDDDDRDDDDRHDDDDDRQYSIILSYQLSIDVVTAVFALSQHILNDRNDN